MKRLFAIAMLLAFGASVHADSKVKLAYAKVAARDDVASETSLTLAVEGTKQAVDFVRSMHPFMSLEYLHIRAEGRLRGEGSLRVLENDDARVRLRYDDEDNEWDFKRSEPPLDLAKEKLKAFAWVAASGRRYTLSPSGEFRAEQADQDHNGEALDLMALAIVRMPSSPVSVGESWEHSWKGSRSEKGKKGVFHFKQGATLEKLEGGVATIAATLEGELHGERDPNAIEAWTKVKGTARLVLEVATGRVVESRGSGAVVAYFRSAAEDGGKNEVRLTIGASGHSRIAE